MTRMPSSSASVNAENAGKKLRIKAKIERNRAIERRKQLEVTMMAMTVRPEMDRNKRWKRLYKDVLRQAFPDACVTVTDLHHFSIQFPEEMERDSFEIPAVDTILNNHALMELLFGAKYYLNIIGQLSVTPTDQRDQLMHDLFYAKYPKQDTQQKTWPAGHSPLV